MTVKAPQKIATSRLILRTPVDRDVESIFARYASDAEVTRCVGWPRHRSLQDTRGFLEFSAGQWQQWPAGPYLIEAQDGQLLGSTGLAFAAADVAMTGYVLARDSWGKGYATEALHAIVTLARELEVRRLFALCHPDHAASHHVLEKCGFACEGRFPDHTEFPNLQPGRRSDTLRYALSVQR